MKKISGFARKNRTKIIYSTILLVIFSVFIVLASVNFYIKREIPKLYIYLSPISYTPKEFPQIINDYPPVVSAQGSVIMDRDSKVTLFEKNPNLRFSPASTTKIMTALVALEYFKMNDVLTVYPNIFEGAVLGISPNEKFRFEDLLYAMMLPSANDAAKTIADNYPGGEGAFVARMNQKANDLGLKNTHFEDPAGLKDQGDYTTPIDLARLASFAMQNPELAKVVSTKSKSITNAEGKEYLLENLNILLDLPGVNGVKTGFTEEAGQVLVTSKKMSDSSKELIVVVMQSQDRFGDSEALLNCLDNNVSYLSIHP
jgi:D-alanyl-D-alanine carboxypeptidase (penicillin-binding protein 5/6)